MALKYGTKWAICMMLAEHQGGTPDAKSAFKTDVDQYLAANPNVPRERAVAVIAKMRIDRTVTPADFQQMASFSAYDIRVSLGLDNYDRAQGSCPNGLDEAALVQALTQMAAVV